MIHVRLSQSLNFQFGAFTVLVLLTLIHSCRGQTHVIGPTRPIVATIGEAVVLQSFLDPVMDAFGMTVEWTRPDLNPSFVYVWRDGVELEGKKHPVYEGRTSVFTEELKLGNISLKLSRVRISDEGRYRCFIPALNKDHVVQLVVGAASSPVVQKTKNSSRVVLQCNSTGWYPEPEVFWLDGEGNLLSAGPTETVRGPDDLYTVSSRVTLEKRHSNSFTCRVQQNHTNQTRETKIHVPEDFFAVQSSSSSTTVILSVSLAVCILVILILGFFVWRQKETKTKWSHRDETDEGEMNRESEVLMTEWPLVTKKRFKKEKQRLKEEKQRREEDVQRKNQELQDKTDEIGSKDETIKKLLQERRDKEKAQSEVMKLKHHLESKNKEWENKVKEEEKKREKAEKEVKDLKTEFMEQLTEEKKKLQHKIQEFNDSQTEVQQLQEQIKKMETGLQTLMEDLESNTLEADIPLHSHMGRSSAGPVQSVPVSKWPEVLRQKFQEKLQKKITEWENKFTEEEKKREKVEEEVKDLNIKMRNKDETIKKLLEERRDKEKAQSEVMMLNHHLESKDKELDGLNAEVNKLTEEKKRSEEEQQKLQTNITELKEQLSDERTKREKAEKRNEDGAGQQVAAPGGEDNSGGHSGSSV